jgi:3-hydroxybutyryl-CoA dehydrogenase
MHITSVVVIGAGPLGRELAYFAARAGYLTVLEDVNSETIERALVAVAGWLDTSGLSIEDRSATIARITTLRSIEDAMRAAELVIDTTIDELETKLEVFTIFDKFARPGAILACCTSSLLVSDLATITFRAERCVGLRLADVGAGLKRVEIVRSARTLEDVVDACVGVGRRFGLEIAIVSEVVEPAQRTNGGG